MVEVAEFIDALGVAHSVIITKSNTIFPIKPMSGAAWDGKRRYDMYNSKFVASIKVNGEFLKEDKLGVVSLPFDSEYEIYLKNEHKDHKAMVEVLVDGESITKKGRLILNEGQYFNLDCFLDDLASNHRFRFVKKADCNPHNLNKKDKAEHSVVEVRFHKEKKKPVTEHHHHWNYPYYPTIPWGTNPSIWHPPAIWYCSTNDLKVSSKTMTFSDTGISNTVSSMSANPTVTSANVYCNMSTPTMDFCGFPINEGVTDKGSKSYQQFSLVHGFDTDDCVTIRIALSGYEVEKSTGPARRGCYYCKISYGPEVNYCSNCGNPVK